jgi:protein-tyrosine phosphatase
MPRIAFQGAANARDLGGIAATDGRKVAGDQLIRSDGLSGLTDADEDLLVGLGLRTVLDFRTTAEIAQLGADRLPADVDVIGLPVNAGDLAGFLAVIGDQDKQRELLGDGKGVEFMKRVNRELVSDDACRQQFARALRVIADAQHRPVLFHCTAGKDRTGWMTAIVLTALGVPRDAVMADYLATNDYVWPIFEKQLAPLAGAGQLDLELFRPLIVQHPDYLNAAFDEAETRYGSFDEFLVRGLDFDSDDLNGLRAALLS